MHDRRTPRRSVTCPYANGRFQVSMTTAGMTGMGAKRPVDPAHSRWSALGSIMPIKIPHRFSWSRRLFRLLGLTLPFFVLLVAQYRLYFCSQTLVAHRTRAAA